MIEHTHPPMSEMYPEGRTDLACTDLDEHHCIREMRSGDGRLARFIIAHDAKWEQPYRCEGSIPVYRSDGPIAGHPVWTVSGSLAGGDLTLSPSVLDPDQACGGDHGWVRDGKWVPA